LLRQDSPAIYWSTAIQEPLPSESTLPTLSDDEELVLALRLRDGRPGPVPEHQRRGTCRYEKFYPNGGCDWCRAIDKRGAAEAPPEPNPDVIVVTDRWQLPHEDVAPRLAA
jgi:hypothetical protein